MCDVCVHVWYVHVCVGGGGSPMKVVTVCISEYSPPPELELLRARNSYSVPGISPKTGRTHPLNLSEDDIIVT